MSSIQALTLKEKAQLKDFVAGNPELVKKLRKSMEANIRELRKKNPKGILIKPMETDISAIASIASRQFGPGAKAADIDWGCVVFVGACVFTG